MRRAFLFACGVSAFALLCGPAVQAATPAQTLAAQPGLPGPLRLVANRVSVAAVVNASNKYAQSMTGHVAASNISQIGVAVANWYFNNGNLQEFYVTNPGTVRLYVEYNGKCAPLTFGGSFTGVLPPSGTLFSDVVTLPFVIPAGATFHTHEYRVVPLGGIVYIATRNAAVGDNFNVQTTVLPDIRCGTPTSIGAFTLPPVAIYGPGTNPSVILVGDSIAHGYKDTPDNDYHAGFTNTYILPSTVVALNLSSSGLSAADYTNNPPVVAQRKKLFTFASTVISEIGTNDVHVNHNTAVVAEGFIQKLYNFFPQTSHIVQTTIASESPTSSDAWTSIGNQAADTFQGVINTLNNDIKSVAIVGQNDYYDTAAQLTPNGLWPLTTRSPASVSDGSATASSTTLTSLTAAFVSSSSPTIAADNLCAISISGAGAGGALLTDLIASVSNGTTVTMGSAATTTSSGATINFSVTNDGIHPCPWGYKAIGPLDTAKIR